METFERHEFRKGELIRKPDPYRYDLDLIREHAALVVPDPRSTDYTLVARSEAITRRLNDPTKNWPNWPKSMVK
jgi:hypothetical protein